MSPVPKFHRIKIRSLGNDHLTWKGGGGVMVFPKKYSDSQCCWKKYSDFGGGEKKSDSEILSYNLMLNSGQNFALCATNKNNILTPVVSEKKFLNENHNPIAS